MNLLNRSQRQSNATVSAVLVGILSLLLTCAFSGQVFAAEATSTSYQLMESSIQASGGYSTSSSFQLQGVIPFISAEMTASGTFQIGSGAAGFPAVVLSVTNGVAGPQYAEVTLTWTEAENLVSPTYEVGQLNPTTGLYVYGSAQTSLTKTIGNLSFAEYYYFVIRVRNGLNEIIGYSNVVQVLPQATVSGEGTAGAPWNPFSGSDTGTTGASTTETATDPGLLTRIGDALNRIIEDAQDLISRYFGSDSESVPPVTPPGTGTTPSTGTGVPGTGNAGGQTSSSTIDGVSDGEPLDLDKIGTGTLKLQRPATETVKAPFQEFLTLKAIGIVALLIISGALFLFFRK